MIKALENPNYKKIWEYVNWQVRHPEAKSLEEALSMEAIKFGCELFNYGETFCHARVVGNNCAGYQYLTVESVDSSNTNPIVIHLNEIGKNVQILGRPIKLEDVISIFNHQPWENRGWIQSFGVEETVNRGEYHISIYDKDYAEVGLCFWQLTKPLHEQTHETWFMLSEFIKTREHVLTVDELPSQTH